MPRIPDSAVVVVTDRNASLSLLEMFMRLHGFAGAGLQTTPCLRSNQTVITRRGAGANPARGRRGDLADPAAIGGVGPWRWPWAAVTGHRRAGSGVSANGVCQRAGPRLRSERGGAAGSQGCGAATRPRGRPGPRPSRWPAATWHRPTRPYLGGFRGSLPTLSLGSRQAEFPMLKPTSVLLGGWRASLLEIKQNILPAPDVAAGCLGGVTALRVQLAGVQPEGPVPAPRDISGKMLTDSLCAGERAVGVTMQG
ncbi:uncharacterized protein LOC135416543 [Pseudopipra pipra]|uniref:uncharacterized protein LOC135416543 n=1 Tax=Pseudopipra pipra TaxID=415032 RepID=UPI00313A149B